MLKRTGVIVAVTFALAAPAAQARLDLDPIGRVALGGAEISAFHAQSQRAFVTDAETNALHIVDLSDPSAPVLVKSVDLSSWGADPNSVAVSPAFGGLVAVAVEAEPKTAPGAVVLFDTDGEQRGAPIKAGALPDMLTFTPDGRTLLVANEGEPNDLYTVDPEGSVTVVDFPRGLGNPVVRAATFAGVPLSGQVRLFGHNTPTPAQDLEPEYIATDGRRAWVTLQENNAIGLLDVRSATFERVVGLGFKDHGQAGAGLDASDRDNSLGSTLPGGAAQLADRIFPRPGVRGMYQPDAITAFRDGEETLLVTANEGDARVYPGDDVPGGPEEGEIFSEEVRVGGIAGLGFTLGDPLAAQSGASDLGRLTVTRPQTVGVPELSSESGDTVSEVFSFGARSLSVWNADGELMADTGDQLERLTYSGNGTWFAGDRANFNKSNSAGSRVDDRSDNKGPEPEAVTVGSVGGVRYAFLGAERPGSIFAFDMTDPAAPAFDGYVNTRTADLGPEGIGFVGAADSPTGVPLLLVSNEVTGTLSVVAVSPAGIVTSNRG